MSESSRRVIPKDASAWSGYREVAPGTQTPAVVVHFGEIGQVATLQSESSTDSEQFRPPRPLQLPPPQGRALWERVQAEIMTGAEPAYWVAGELTSAELEAWDGRGTDDARISAGKG